MSSDPFYASTRALLPMVGPSAQSNGQICYASTPCNYSFLLNGGQFSQSVFKYYGSSHFCNQDVRMRLVGATLPASGAFTLECWAYQIPQDPDESTIFSSASSGTGRNQFGIVGGQIQFWFGGSPTRYIIAGPVVFQDGFHHAAWCRGAGGPLRMYVDGVLVHTEPLTQNFIAADLYYGDYGTLGSRWLWGGYVNDIRFTLAERYTADFTPPGPLVPQAQIMPALTRKMVAATLYEISGTAVKLIGGPAEVVFVFDWNDRWSVQKTAPDENGEWAVLVPAGDYGIVYTAPNCVPVCHGPYAVTA